MYMYVERTCRKGRGVELGQRVQLGGTRVADRWLVQCYVQVGGIWSCDWSCDWIPQRSSVSTVPASSSSDTGGGEGGREEARN